MAVLVSRVCSQPRLDLCWAMNSNCETHEEVWARAPLEDMHVCEPPSYCMLFICVGILRAR